jgi:hypothetical protein
MCTRYDSIPPSSVLIGSGSENDDYASALGQRLSKKFNIQCFVSCNVPPHMIDGIQMIEPALREKLSSTY